VLIVNAYLVLKNMEVCVGYIHACNMHWHGLAHCVLWFTRHHKVSIDVAAAVSCFSLSTLALQCSCLGAAWKLAPAASRSADAPQLVQLLSGLMSAAGISWVNWLAVVTVAQTMVEAAATTAASAANDGDVPPAVLVPLAGGLVHVIQHSTVSQVCMCWTGRTAYLFVYAWVGSSCCVGSAGPVFLHKKLHAAVVLGIHGAHKKSLHVSSSLEGKGCQ
jgi:hypothetical protein